MTEQPKHLASFPDRGETRVVQIQPLPGEPWTPFNCRCVWRCKHPEQSCRAVPKRGEEEAHGA
jgi:hypothetical protein